MGGKNKLYIWFTLSLHLEGKSMRMEGQNFTLETSRGRYKSGCKRKDGDRKGRAMKASD